MDPTCSIPTPSNTPLQCFLSSLFSSSPPSGSFFWIYGVFFFSLVFWSLHLNQAMFFHQDEAVQYPCTPVHETMLTESEIEDLFSLINHSTDPASPGSGSQGSNRVVYSPEERKLRRMQSNRESARRSRYRKKQHMENLTSQLNQLRIQNRLIKNQLASTMHQHLLLSLHNDHLKSESVALMATLSDLCGILGTMLSH